MTDIARLGVAFDTTDLKAGSAALQSLVPPAKQAQKAADDLARSASTMGASVKAAASGITTIKGATLQASSGLTMSAKAALSAGSAMGTVKAAASGASGAIEIVGLAAQRTGTMMGQADAHMVAYRNSLASLPAAAGAAQSSLARLGAAANNNINAMQSTPGNIAAQFQDIGVTAAAGMSPMIIALQQGTQLSAAFAGGIGNLGAAFKQIFSPTALLTIGIVGLIAAGIQMVDWIGVAQSLLHGLADAMEFAAVGAVYLGGVMLIAFGPQILGAIVRVSIAIGTALVAAIKSATMAMIVFAAANPFAAIIIAIGLVIGAMWLLNDAMGGVFGNILKWIRNTANKLIGGFVGAYNTIVRVWDKLPDALGDAAYRAANRVAKEMNSLFTIRNEETGEKWTPFNEKPMKNPYSGALASAGAIAAEEMGKAQGRDYVGGFVSGVQDLAGRAAGALRGFADGLGGDDKKKKDKAEREARERATKPEKTNDELFAEVTEGADKQLRSLLDLNAQIGVYGEHLMRLKYEQALFNDAQDRGVKLTEAMTAELKNRAAEMASLEQSSVEDAMMEKVRRDHEDTMWAMERERGEIRLNGIALEAYRRETELLTQARRDNIDLTPEQITALRAVAAEEAATAAAIREAQEALNFARDSTRSFFKEWFDGIRQGKGLFESFADAVVNGLNRIIDRMLDKAIDGFIDMLFFGGTGAPGGGGGGFLGKLLGNIIGGGFGGGGGSGGTNGGFGGGVPGGSGIRSRNALGNAFDDGGLYRFAKGESFTNQVVNRPTLFRFAKGAKLGEMGEAGPEAILPLERTSDGSLGVRSTGTAGPATVINDVQVSNTFHVSGALTSDDIMRALRESSKQTQGEVKRQLNEWLTQYQRDGAIV